MFAQLTAPKLRLGARLIQAQIVRELDAVPAADRLSRERRGAEAHARAPPADTLIPVGDERAYRA